jgi:hypothetical protein
MATPESKVKKKGRTILDQMGVYHFPPFSGGYGRAGIPDDIGCYRGRFIAIEYKANGGKPTALQLRELQNIRESGGIALIIDETNVENLMELIHGEIQTLERSGYT